MSKADAAAEIALDEVAPSDALQGDWEWIIKILRMTTDRVIDGQRVTLYRPKSFSKSADMKTTMEAAVMRQVRTILSTAEVIDD